MSIFGQSPFLERLQFFNGQRLFASDLQQLEAFHREMRWLHNQSLHQPGIGNGFEVLGKKGDREVRILPGYAIDALGREIVLQGHHVEPVPPVAGHDAGQPVFFDLTVAYPDDRDLEEAETRAGVCLPRGVVRLREEPVFCWVRLGANGQPIDERLKQEMQQGLKIVLARAEVLNCQLNSDISLTVRRSARPSKQPYVACGKVKPTDWNIWPIVDPIPRFKPQNYTIVLPFGLKTNVNTNGAKFITTPCYSAQIIGSRVVTSSDRIGLLDGMINIQNPRPYGFELFVLLIVQPFVRDRNQTSTKPLSTVFEAERSFASLTEDEKSRLLKLFSDWYVVWMGIEG